MHSKKSICFLIALISLGSMLLGHSDEIKLKNGETLKGKITYEADDIVKIEVAISGTIKETKIIATSDIEKLTKEAPDSVAFKALNAKLPVPSLAPAEHYRVLIESGPNTFLKNFPGSEHGAKVTEIKEGLEEELDKVERGFIKLEEDWISPQDQAQYETLVQSRIKYLQMEAALKGNNLNAMINGLRAYEQLEDKYYGTPAFAKALPLAAKTIPLLGQNLQRLHRDADFRNSEWEKSLLGLDEAAKTQLQSARAREDANFAAAAEADKKAGIKWMRVNPRDKSALEAYLKLAQTELTRVREYDPELVAKQSEKFKAVDELIAEGRYELAKTRLETARAITGKSSKSSKKGAPSSYPGVLSAKLKEKMEEQRAKMAAEKEAAKSQSLTSDLQKSRSNPSGGDQAETEGEAADADDADIFSALNKTKKKEEAKKEEESKSQKSSSDKDDDDEEEEREPVAEKKNLMPIIIPVVTVLLIGTILVLKFLGIGGKKDDEEEEESEE